MLVCLILSQSSLNLYLVSKLFFLLIVWIGCFLLHCDLNCYFDLFLHVISYCSLLVCVDLSFWLLYSLFLTGCFLCTPHIFFILNISLLKFSVSFLSILITNVLKSISSGLLVSISFCSFSGDFYFFIWDLFLSSYFGFFPVFVSMHSVGQLQSEVWAGGLM